MNHDRAPPLASVFMFLIALAACLPLRASHAEDDASVNKQILADLNITSTGRGETHDELRAIAALDKRVAAQQQDIAKLNQLAATQQKQIDAQQKEIASLRSAGQGYPEARSATSPNSGAR